MSLVSKFGSRENTSLPMFRTRKQGRILLIEPDSNTRQELKFLLSSQGYDVYIAADIPKAYSLSRFKGFAFILFNWFIEGGSGFELGKQIRTVNKTTPLFFYTIQGPGDGLIDNIETKIQGYDMKPVDTSIILKTIFLQMKKNRIKPSLTDTNL